MVSCVRIGQFRFNEFHQAKVEDLRVSITGDHDVVGLEVAMDNAHGMGLSQTLSHVLQVAEQFPQLRIFPINLVAKRNALDKLHGYIVRAIVLPDLEDLRNVGMAQRRRRFSFPNETLHPISIRRDVCWKNLECDFAIVDKERTWKILEAMAPIAKAHNCSPARISLAWLLAKPVVTSVILGAKRLDQLQDNLAAMDLKLSEDEIKKLDEVSALPPEYPSWMLYVQNAERLGVAERPVWDDLSESGSKG